MAQGILPFKYEKEKQKSDMTAFGGLPTYLDLAQVVGLSRSVERHLGVRTNSQGRTDSQVVMSLLLLNISGGDCVEDLHGLEGDEGFCKILDGTQMHGMSRQQRRSVPSPSSVFRYLSAFHDPEQEGLREPGKAFIPAGNERLRGFTKVNGDFLSFVQKHNPQKTATLDMDATLVETNKSEALFCYKGFKSYQSRRVGMVGTGGYCTYRVSRRQCSCGF